jgi:hypothetical protein
MLNISKAISNISIDCLLPNGLLLTLNVSKDMTLNELLNKINKESSGLYSFENNFNDCIFSGLNEEALPVEYYDLSKKISELDMFQAFPFFKLINNETLDYNAKVIKSDLSKSKFFFAIAHYLKIKLILFNKK